MSWWETSDGEAANVGVGTEYEVSTSMEPLPDGTKVLAMIDDVKWKEKYNSIEEYLEIRWSALKPDAYLNRKIFQKLWVSDPDPSAKDPQAKHDKALRMLATIDANAGGKLAKTARKPSNEDLQVALLNKQMVIRLGLWESEGKSGNWVQAVAPKGSEISVVATPARKASNKSLVDDDDSDIPF